MVGRFVFVPDPTNAPRAERVELFTELRDVSTVPQVADALGVCPNTVRRLVASGELPCIHVGRSVRITRAALVDFVEAQAVSA